MRAGLASFPPLLMIPCVIALWFFGTVAALFFLSYVNFPGINEWGSGALFFMTGLLVVVVGPVVHIVLILHRRSSSVQDVDEAH
jgi:hypothetical protein